jgi:F-box protein 45
MCHAFTIIMANSIDISILEEIFYYLSVKDLVKCSRVCKKWHRILNEENSTIWQSKFQETGTNDFRKCPHITNMTYKARVLAYECAWNDDDHSKNIYLMNNCLTLHRNPVAQSTDGARSKAGFCSGQHYFIIIFHGPNLGSAAIVGVSTKKAPLHSNGYCSLLGSDEHGWGWNLSDNTMRHKGEDLATVTEVRGMIHSPRVS